jgi:hypothetical protein
MSDAIYWELYYIADCFLWGVILAALYDAVCIIRILIPHGTLIIAVEDFCYWSAAAIGMFLILYREDDGTLRWFAIAAVLLAMLLIHRYISKYTVPWVGNLLARPLRFLTKAARNFILSVKKFLTNQLKNIWKRFIMIRKIKNSRRKSGEAHGKEKTR